MTRHELEIRKEAVLAAYRDHDIEKACDLEMKLYERNPSKKLYRFRPPREHDVEALRKAQIYLCRPRCYEDLGDCGWIDDIPALVEYDLKVRSKDKYSAYQNQFTHELYDTVEKEMLAREDYAKMRETSRNMCLISCITDVMTDYMWENYTENFTGVCFEYDFEEVVKAISLLDSVRFFPVWYVDDRNNTPEIKFGVKEYEEETGEAMHQKYILSCMVKDKVPYAQESEWRLLCENTNIPLDEKGKLFSFIRPSKIYLGKNIREDFKSKIQAVADEFTIEVVEQKEKTA